LRAFVEPGRGWFLSWLAEQDLYVAAEKAHADNVWLLSAREAVGETSEGGV
jgi:hypothetical protein